MITIKEYDGLYAVWKRDQFHIYHSGTGEVQDVDMPEEGTTIDLTEYVADKTKYLYGGYYHTDLNNLTKGEPYTEPGTRLVPVADTVYYLKEVPNTYLKPQIYLIYNTVHYNLIQGLYGFVNVDSNVDYSTCGLSVGGTDYPFEDSLVSGSFQVIKKGETEPYAELNASNLFGMGSSDPCYIGKSTLTALIKGGDTLQISGYYVTRDGIKVTGYKDRMIKFAANDERYDAPIWTGWSSNGGNTKTGLKTVGTTAKEITRSSATRMTVKRTLMLSAPSDKIEYTVTKIYDSGTEEQTVEGGNYTGQITYVPEDGYMFAGWYQDADFTTPADFSDVSGDMTVYAKYISNKDVTIAFSRKSKKSDTTTFNATISVKNRDQLDNVTVNVNDDISAVLADKSVKKSGSGKNVKYTTQYKGQVAVKGLSLVDSFTASASWTTPDGTPVTGTNRKCTYLLGNVTVR